MSNTSKPATKPTSSKNVSKTPKTEVSPSAPQPRQQFFAAALTMSWQMALVVLVPVLLGAWLDDHFNTKPVYIFVGFVIAMIGSAFVLRAQLQKVTPPEDNK